jgi:hypothetical protein
MFDDIIGSPNKPDPAQYIKATRGEVAETNRSGNILVIYVDPNDGEMYYFKYVTKKKFKMGDEVEIIFEDLDSGSPQQICERWTIDNQKKDEICVEEVRKIKK